MYVTFFESQAYFTHLQGENILEDSFHGFVYNNMSPCDGMVDIHMSLEPPNTTRGTLQQSVTMSVCLVKSMKEDNLIVGKDL